MRLVPKSNITDTNVQIYTFFFKFFFIEAELNYNAVLITSVINKVISKVT